MRAFAVGAGVVLWLALRSSPACAEPAATAPPSYPATTAPPPATTAPPPASTPPSYPTAGQPYPTPAPAYAYAYPPPPAYGWQGAPATLPYRDDKLASQHYVLLSLAGFCPSMGRSWFVFLILQLIVLFPLIHWAATQSLWFVLLGRPS